MVLLVIAAAGILMPFAGAANMQTEAARQTAAANLASELMEKILMTDYASIISTYDGYNEAEGDLLDAAGILHNGDIYAGFSRCATCSPATVGSVDLIAVTVTVYYQNQEISSVTTLVGDHG